VAGGSQLSSGAGGFDEGESQAPIVKSDREKIGRNEPCWCGSGKKYKLCHGAN
jgi:preprotein translocase subunit SecA